MATQGQRGNRGWVNNFILLVVFQVKKKNLEISGWLTIGGFLGRLRKRT